MAEDADRVSLIDKHLVRSRHSDDITKTAFRKAIAAIVGLIAVVCTVVNVSLIGATNRGKQFDMRTSTALKELEFIDTYIGLDSAIY
ncbi:hypothetical protein NP233_g9947 [Leucocoprinus birnbaumii]|uniref:Uncharacterized protein n=1 Tax=Leucocoprinus birnbaumii TaxID=56174 RepID=A0AAD5YLS8_9AGAR|nr:hypothetical protein NP233_g9947 [Leucocoprinus birnbaumii]